MADAPKSKNAPTLDEMTDAALKVINKFAEGIEAAGSGGKPFGPQKNMPKIEPKDLNPKDKARNYVKDLMDRKGGNGKPLSQDETAILEIFEKEALTERAIRDAGKALNEAMTNPKESAPKETAPPPREITGFKR